MKKEKLSSAAKERMQLRNKKRKNKGFMRILVLLALLVGIFYVMNRYL